ncbi:MAG: CHAP domain-containing protein [Pirellulaceae bacterium]
MKRLFNSFMCGVAMASLLGSVSPTSAAAPKGFKTKLAADTKTSKPKTAADPKGFKPSISASPTVVSMATTAKSGKTTLSYNAGSKHPYVEVWVSINGANMKKVLEDEGDGKGSRTVTIEKGKKYRFVLTDFGKQLASADVSTKITGTGTTPGTGGGTKPDTNPVPKPADVSLAVLNFAASKVGQKGLGDGQCTRLIEAALAAAGAKPGKGFVWGRTLMTGETMRPGDIIQFTSVVIKDGFSTWNLGAPNHTAIVSQVNGTKVTLLHQNMDGEPAIVKSHVRSQELDFSKKVSGTFIVYRPEAK